MLGTEAFREACQRVLLHAKDPYAKSFAKAGIDLVHLNAGREAISCQALYILSNLAFWHGPEARMVKATLREFTL